MSEPDQAPGAPEDEPGVSEMLIRAREAAGLTREDVAAQLFLTVTFIDYIDQGQFQKIPKGIAFIKGYLRSYARVVGLDGDEMVGRYEAALPGSSDVAPIRDVTEETVGPVTFTGPVLQTGLMALAGLAIVVALVWYFATRDSEETGPDEVGVSESAPAAPDRARQPVIMAGAGSRNERSDDRPPALLPDPESALSGASGQRPGDARTPAAYAVESDADRDRAGGEEISDTLGVPEPGESVALHTDNFALMGQSLADSQSLALSRVDDAPMNEFEDPGVNIDREGEGDDRLITVTADGSDVLDFSFTDDCWVQIEDAANKVIYADLNRVGDVMNVTGTGPFTVLLGKAPAVRMDYNGARFDLARYTMNDETARVRTR